MVKVTSAMPRALRSRVPAKITSCMCVPRRLFALCSPSTQLTASRMFDLPHPLGPTTVAMPVPVTVNSVRSQKLLNPRMWIFFNFSIPTPIFLKDQGRVCGYVLPKCGYDLLSGSVFPAPKLRANCCYPITDSTEPESQGQRRKRGFLWIRESGIPVLGK